MIPLVRAAWVIARRDYIATVWSRSFLILLAAPLLPVLIGALAGALGDKGDDAPRHRDAIAVVMDAGDARALAKARAHLAPRLDKGIFPLLQASRNPEPGQARLTGSLDRPRLIGPPDLLHDMGGSVALLIDQARSEEALGTKMPAPVDLETTVLPTAPDAKDRADVGGGGQIALTFLTIMLAGMMLSNLVEEKSNKVIELLAAAVSIDAIFFGKLLAMLAASATALAVWSAIGVAAAEALMPVGTLPVPAVGWPAFFALGFVYFVTVFLLWGAIFMGVGAHASSAREAQSLTMPMTLLVGGAFIIASAQISHPDRLLPLVAAIIPWSSPFAMIGRASVDARLWPHLIAIVWQLIVIAMTIRLGARLFRTNILNSGPSRRAGPWWRRTFGGRGV
jgi:ABC-2 type transport system permease protein